MQQPAGDIDIAARRLPFQLIPDMPPERKTQARHPAGVYGRSLEAMEAMRAQTATAAGYRMTYRGKDSDPPGR